MTVHFSFIDIMSIIILPALSTKNLLTHCVQGDKYPMGESKRAVLHLNNTKKTVTSCLRYKLTN